MEDFFNRLKEFMRRGDAAGTENFLREQVAQLKNSVNSNALDMVVVLNELGGFLRGISRYTESEQCFLEAMSIMELRQLETTDHFATIAMNLAGTYRLQGRFDDAISLFLKSKSLFERLNECESFPYLGVINNLALLYQEIGQHQDAYTMMLTALELAKKLQARASVIATTLSNLAAIRLGMGYIEEAESIIAEALSMFDGLQKPDAHHASALAAAASIAFRKEKYSDALDNFLKSLSMTEMFFGKNIEYAITGCNLAKTYEALHDMDEARKHQRIAVNIMEQLLGFDHIKAIQNKKILENMA